MEGGVYEMRARFNFQGNRNDDQRPNSKPEVCQGGAHEVKFSVELKTFSGDVPWAKFDSKIHVKKGGNFCRLGYKTSTR